MDWGSGGEAGAAALALKGPGEMARRRELLHNFLSIGGQEVSLFTLAKFLDRPQALELLVSFITRDETPIAIAEDFDDVRYSTPFRYSGAKLSNAEADDDVKRAFNAVTILSGHHQVVDAVVQRHAVDVVAPILRAFRAPKSKASVYHLCAVLEAVIALNPEAVLAYIAEGPRMRLCVGALLENCHVPKVVDVTFSLLSQRPAVVRPETLKILHKRMLSWGPLALLVERITSAQQDEPRAFGWAELISRVVADFDVSPEGEDQGDPALLKALTNAKLVENVVRCACQQQTSERAEAALHLMSILTSVIAGKPLSVQASPVAPPDKSNTTEIFMPEVRRPHRLIKLAGEFRQAMAPHVAMLCQALDESAYAPSLRRHSSYELAAPFGFRRLTLIRALVAVATTPAALAAVPWESLCRLRMQYTNNSLFQCEFCTLFDRALKCDFYSSPLRTVVEDLGFVDQLITRVHDFPQDSDHGHALQCLNMLRLRMQQLPEGHWLHESVGDDEAWQEALAVICKQTRRMLLPLKTPLDANTANNATGAAQALQSFFDRDNPLSSDLASSFDRLAEDEALDSLDIDVGSPYATALGYERAALVDPDAEAAMKKQKKDKKKHKAKAKKKR